MSRMTASIKRINDKFDTISGLDGYAADIIENSIEPIVSIICDCIHNQSKNNCCEPIPYENLNSFVNRPVFIVYGGIKMWTILNSINETSAHFSQSSDFGVYLEKDKCGIKWFAYEREPKEKN